MEKNYDVIIIGAGASGSLASHQISKAGYKVLLLDAGPSMDQDIDKKDSDFSYQTRSYAYNDNTKKYIADDKTLHFINNKEQFRWSHVCALGGRTLLWQGVSLRFTDRQFKAAQKDG